MTWMKGYDTVVGIDWEDRRATLQEKPAVLNAALRGDTPAGWVAEVCTSMALPLSLFVLLVSKLKEKRKGSISKWHRAEILLRHGSWNYRIGTSTTVIDDVFKCTRSRLATLKDSVFVAKIRDGVSKSG